MRPWLSVALLAFVLTAGCKDAAKEAPPAEADADAAPTDAPKGEPAKGNDDEAAEKEAAPAKAGDETDGKKKGGRAETVKQAVADAEPIEGLELIPSESLLVAGVDVAALVKLPIWAELRDSLGTRQREQMRAATDCGAGPDKWRTFVIGTDPTTRGMAMVVTVEGIGKKETLKCLEGALGFELSPDGKTMSDHTGGGIVVDDDAIAFASTGWMRLLEARIEGKGSSVAEGSLSSAIKRSDPGKTLWVAGTLPPAQRTMAAAFLGKEPQDVAGWADLAAGLKVQLSVTVDDAKGVLSSLQLQWLAFRGGLESRGVPKGIVDSVTFSEKGGAVYVDVSATADETRTLTDNVRGMMGI